MISGTTYQLKEYATSIEYSLILSNKQSKIWINESKIIYVNAMRNEARIKDQVCRYLKWCIINNTMAVNGHRLNL